MSRILLLHIPCQIWEWGSIVKLVYYSVSHQVNLLLARWMKELEKIFYGSVAAYEAALVPEAKQDELQNALFR